MLILKNSVGEGQRGEGEGRGGEDIVEEGGRKRGVIPPLSSPYTSQRTHTHTIYIYEGKSMFIVFTILL